MTNAPKGADDRAEETGAEQEPLVRDDVLGLRADAGDVNRDRADLIDTPPADVDPVIDRDDDTADEGAASR